MTFAHARSYPAEFLASGTNDALLREIAKAGNGKFDPQPAEIFARPGRPSRRQRDLTNWFLAGALALLPADIFLRRRTWRT